MTPSDADLEKAREIAGRILRDGYCVHGGCTYGKEGATCMNCGVCSGHDCSDCAEEKIATAIAEARASENEACAKEAEKTVGGWKFGGMTRRSKVARVMEGIAASIRSRKESQ